MASKIGAVTEYIADRKNGFFIEPGSVDDMTNALMRIADLTATEYASLRSCARIVAAEYDENKIVKEYRSVFQKVCHDGKT